MGTARSDEGDLQAIGLPQLRRLEYAEPTDWRRVLYGDDEDYEDEPTMSCSECGSRDNLVQCVQTGGWYCNNRPSHDVSCILMHLAVNECHSIRLPASSRWGAFEVCCQFTGVDDIFRLGLASMGTLRGRPGFAVVSRAHAAKMYPPMQGDLRPAVTRFALASWLCNSREATEVHAAGARARTRRRQWGNKALAAPIRFSDVGSYFKHFTSLVALLATHEGNSSSRSRVNVTMTWTDGLQGPVACFAYNNGGRDDLRLGESVYIRHAAFPEEATDGAATDSDSDEEPEEWTAIASVVGVGVGGDTAAVAVALQDCTGGLRAVDFSRTAGYHVSPQRLSVELDRMQTGLSVFVSDEVSSCDFRVQQAVLGFSVPSRATLVALPLEAAPGCPPLSMAQAAAIQGAFEHPLYRFVGPPGTGKTTTTVQLVHNLARSDTGQILVCSPSNAACNLLARRLQGAGLTVL